MCRSIKQLRSAESPATPDEVRAAALQFVRKISGYRTPSEANMAVFNAAVDQITNTSTKLLGGLRPGARVSHRHSHSHPHA